MSSRVLNLKPEEMAHKHFFVPISPFHYATDDLLKMAVPVIVGNPRHPAPGQRGCIVMEPDSMSVTLGDLEEVQKLQAEQMAHKLFFLYKFHRSTT